MILLTPQQYGALGDFATNEEPGPVVFGHVIQTGNGSVWVDRWPLPRAILAETAGNYVLIGDPRALNAVELQERIRGFVAAPPEWLPALEYAFTTVTRWERVILELKGDPHFTLPGNDFVRRLAVSDAGHLQVLRPATAWVAKTWGGPAGLAASGYAWGAFADGRLVSVACTFFVGFRHEDLGVATEPGVAKPDPILVVHDEMDLEPGRLQARSGGGLAGHNGLRSIAAHLKTSDFLRLRVGVGRPGRGDPRKGADYVLSNFTAEEDAETLVARAADAVERLDAEGLERAQAQFK